MFLLTNDSLTVQVLDPIADRERLGTRYCTAGYIFQILDANHGELLTGPTYPDDFNTFDGQGIPDAFRLGPIQRPGASDGTALVIGVGVCDLEGDKVLEFCQWDISQTGNSLTFRTTQSFEEASLELERTVSLLDRTVRSETRLRNLAKRPLPFRWFPPPH
jgi:hypothetical protein